MNTNRRVILAERPRYIVPTANCFKMDTASMPSAEAGQLLIRTLWLSMDAMLYSRVQRVSNDREPLKLGDVMLGPAVGRVEESQHPDYRKGDLLSGFWGWQDYTVSNGSKLRRLDFGIQQASYAVSAYGASGFGAYIALEKLAIPAAGETVVVGTAVGGLGQIAGQIAKIKGCRVVGITSSIEKCKLATEALGYDACVSYESKDFAEQLRAACPKGVDVYVETIGSKVLDTVMPLLNVNARIAACGLMGTPHFGESAFSGKYSSTMSFLYALINRRISVRGLVAVDHVRSSLKDFHRDMKGWIDSGQIKPLDDVVVGLERAPAAFQDIFEGKNLGKRLVKVAD